tara:strand:- start:6993 stop:7793 length:801 start_codon:yes stop_codon:yes gene_type:complete
MSCIICSTVFKNEGFLKKSFENIKILSYLFTNIKIVLCYDNSGDNTLKELCELKREGWDIDIIVNKKDRFGHQYGRAYNIGQARNQCLDYIEEHFSDYTYFIMADLDDIWNFDLNPMILGKYILNEALEEEWDSLSFYNEGFYDTWSVSIDHLQESGWVPGVELDKCWENQVVIRDYLRKVVQEMSEEGDDMRPIDSIFNGFCIHKLDKFTNIRYQPATLLNDEIFIDCEHRSFYRRANEKGLKVMLSKDCLFEKMKNVNKLNTEN